MILEEVVYPAHEHSLNKWIIVSSADLQNEQRGNFSFPKSKRGLFRSRALFEILY